MNAEAPTMSLTSVAALRRKLGQNGFRPVALHSNEKRPFGAAWQERARQNPPEATTAPPHPAALNTGILCYGLRALDVDVDDPALAEQLEALATETLGPAPVRWRANSGRRLLLYRSAEGAAGRAGGARRGAGRRSGDCWQRDLCGTRRGRGMMQKRRENPLNLAQAAPRCGARNRQGGACMSPAMANGRCRLHGGKSTGPRTTEGIARIKAARTVQGLYGAEARELRRHIRELLAGAAHLVEET